MPCPAGRDGARPLQGAEQACGGGVRLGCGHPALRKQGRWCVVTARRGRRALRVQCKWYPAYGPMWALAPTESPISHPSQPARSEASAPAAARDGRESTQRPSQKGKPAATAGAALSEAESAERAAGQIRFLPDDLRVQHGVQRSEVSARPRPCSRRGCVDWAGRFRAASRCARGRGASGLHNENAFFLLTAPPPFSFWGAKKKMGVASPQGMPCHHAPFGAAGPWRLLAGGKRGWKARRASPAPPAGQPDQAPFPGKHRKNCKNLLDFCILSGIIIWLAVCEQILALIFE